LPAGADTPLAEDGGGRVPDRLEATKKYQFTHPIAATPATMTSQSVPDMRSS
jgi:hypothetical protein